MVVLRPVGSHDHILGEDIESSYLFSHDEGTKEKYKIAGADTGFVKGGGVHLRRGYRIS